MSNIFEEIAIRLKNLQQRLIVNREANIRLANNFSVCFQNNLNFFQHYSPNLYKEIITHNITRKKIVCFENGEANLLDLKTGTLLYEESPIEETKQQVKKWLNGNNVYIKSSTTAQNDDFCQLHFYIQNNMHTKMEKFIETHHLEPKLSDHEITQELPLLVINGGGLGYPLLELCSQIEPKFIYYIEPDIEIFLCSLGVIDWASILSFLKNNNQFIHFIIGSGGSEAYRYYCQQIKLIYPFLESYQLIFTHYNSTNTDLFLNLLKGSVSKGMSSNGMFDDALFGINSIIENTKKYPYLKNKHPQTYRNLPIAIVANGPSLDDDLEYLKQHQNNFIIVACGTAVTALDKSDIVPDFYMDIERVDANYKALLYVTNNKIFEHTINISLNVAHPLGLAKFAHTIIVDKASESITRLFKNYAYIYQQSTDVLSCLNTNPLVSNGAISTFLNLDFNNLYLFGTDNGALSNEKIHSSKSLYFSNDGEFADDTLMKSYESHETSGNFGGLIKTNSLFNECKSNIEIEITKHPDAKIYNCSNGAFIKGTIPIHSADLKVESNINKIKKEYMKYILTDGCKKINLESLELNSFFNKNRFNELIDLIINIWNTTQAKSTKLDLINKMKLTLDYLSDKKYEMEHSLLNGTLKVCFSSIISALYTFKDNNITNQLVSICITHILEFLNLSKELYQNAEKMLQGSHYEYEPKVVYDYWKKTKKSGV